MAIAFCWAWHVGAWRHEVNPIALKARQRPAKSLIRYGFDGIRQAVLNAADDWEPFEHVLSLLQKVAHLAQSSPSTRPRIILSSTAVYTRRDCEDARPRN